MNWLVRHSPAIVCILVALLTGTTVLAQTNVTPSQISAILVEGQCTTETVIVSTGEAVVPKLDVAFVMDVTGSMSPIIDEVNQDAFVIMAGVRELVPESAFAVATFADYEGLLGGLFGYGDLGDYPWRLDQDITENQDKIKQALERIELLSGGDGPESYLRALGEVPALNWRSGTRRIVVLFGDSYPHEPDPGRDAQEGTADDLTRAMVFDRLAEANITVISVFSNQLLRDFYDEAAQHTEGQSFHLTDVSAIPAEISRMVRENVRQLRNLTLEPEAGYEDWLTWSPAQYRDVMAGDAPQFAVTLCRPRGAPSGEHRFDLLVTGDGATLGVIPVRVRDRAGFPWLPLLIALGSLCLLAFALWLWSRRSRRLPRRPATVSPRSPKPARRPVPLRPGEKRSPPPQGRDVTHGKPGRR